MQKMKELIKPWVPPAILQSAYRLRAGKHQDNRLRYFSDRWVGDMPAGHGWNSTGVAEQKSTKFAEFLRKVGGTGPLGFSHDSLDTQDVYQVGCHNLHLTFGYVLALAARKKDRVSVLDWGGGLGQYYQLGQALVPDVALEYHCVETPEMAAAGRKVNPEVRWSAEV
jgi:hypothetical protein